MWHNIIKGSVLDVRGDTIPLWLRRYDAQLEVRWSSQKGKWEVWRRPTKKTELYQGEVSPGCALYTVEYLYKPLVHHVLDAEVLDWRVPARIKAMDTQGDKNWVKRMEYESQRVLDKREASNREELKYAVKQHAKVFREWAESVSRGQNPGRVLNRFRPS